MRKDLETRLGELIARERSVEKSMPGFVNPERHKDKLSELEDLDLKIRGIVQDLKACLLEPSRRPLHLPSSPAQSGILLALLERIGRRSTARLKDSSRSFR